MSDITAEDIAEEYSSLFQKCGDADLVEKVRQRLIETNTEAALPQAAKKEILHGLDTLKKQQAAPVSDDCHKPFYEGSPHSYDDMRMMMMKVMLKMMLPENKNMMQEFESAISKTQMPPGAQQFFDQVNVAKDDFNDRHNIKSPI